MNEGVTGQGPLKCLFLKDVTVNSLSGHREDLTLPVEISSYVNVIVFIFFISHDF